MKSAVYQYVVLHQSCKNRAGVAAAQAVHAACESLTSLPVHPETHVVVLEAKTSDELEELAINLSSSGIPHALIHEPDEPYNGAATALGVGPMAREDVAPFMVQFKALR